MNWKEKIHDAISVGLSTDYDGEALDKFIETLLEKLIEEDIPMYTDMNVSDREYLQAKLRAKWLGK